MVRVRSGTLAPSNQWRGAERRTARVPRALAGMPLDFTGNRGLADCGAFAFIYYEYIGLPVHVVSTMNEKTGLRLSP